MIKQFKATIRVKIRWIISMNKLSNLESFSIPVILTSSAVFDYSRRLTRDQELKCGFH